MFFWSEISTIPQSFTRDPEIGLCVIRLPTVTFFPGSTSSRSSDVIVELMTPLRL